MAEDQQETAKSFADVLNFPKRLGFLDEHTRIPLGPWGPWDGAAAILGLGLTGWGMYVWFYDGYARWIAMFGMMFTAMATYAARQIPISRPSPRYRMLWVLNCFIGTQSRAAVSGKRDLWKSPPKAVIDNLVFTKGGVYADFILAEQPSGMQRFAARRAIAADHRPLVRQLPSGIVFWGVSPRVDTKRLQQRMIAGREHQPRWIREVREWEPFLAENLFYEQVFGVRVPVDAGMAGRSAAGSVAKLTSAVIGRDQDAPDSLDALREVVAQILGKLSLIHI